MRRWSLNINCHLRYLCGNLFYNFDRHTEIIMKVKAKLKIFLLLIVVEVLYPMIPAFAQLPYQNPDLPVDERVNDLISRMTLAEKVAQLGNSTSTNSRLGIPGYNYWSEGLHGVARSGLATSFPQAIALSSTWDRELIYTVASAISDEARVKNNTDSKGLTYWCPTINMARDPRWGRTEEVYGEDPYLTGQLALNFVKGMQGNDPRYLKTVATVKHFDCNNIENGRHSISSTVDERSLREYYLPAFKTCVTQGHVFSLMSAYNALNNVPCPADRTLLTYILRDEWRFKGYVVSDCDAVHDVWASHNFLNTAGQATALSIHNGTDLNCGTTYQQNAAGAVNNGLLNEADIDSSLKRILKARFLLGEFDPPASVPYTTIPDSALDSHSHRDLALKAAREAIVLLKNENSLLPLNKDSVKTVAVIGPNANVLQLGGYSGSPSVSVTVFQGIEKKYGIDPERGKIEAENFDHQQGIQVEACAEGGSDVGYIDNGDYTEYDSVNFDTLKTVFSARVASLSTAGIIEVRLDSLNGSLVDTLDVPITGDWQSWTTVTDSVHVSGVHNLYLEYSGGFNVNWIWFYNPQDTLNTGNQPVNYEMGCTISGAKDQAAFDSAVSLAKRSDVAIVVCGTDLTVANEGHDRTTLDLPGVQKDLIQAVHAVNPKTVVVLVNGFPLSIDQTQDSIPAILCGWYDGQSQGDAIADVLFGDYNPGGRLTSTWYKSVSDLPPMDDYNIRDNRTYMYFTGTPLYPFGYGLSYTTFQYSNLNLSSASLNLHDSITVSVNVKNTGKMAGDEVVQLYTHIQQSSVKRPLKELRDFQRVHLDSGQTKTVNFTLRCDDLTFYDVNTRAYEVENGQYDIMIGSSSADIRLSSQINVSGGKVADTYRLDPYSPLQAEDLEEKSGIATLISCAEGGQSIGSLANNNYLVYKNLDFKNGAAQFNARLAVESLSTGGGSIDIRLDSLNGPLAGTLNMTPTGNWQIYQTQFTKVSIGAGIHDVYLVSKTTQTQSCNLHWFDFQVTYSGIPETKEVNDQNLVIYPNAATTHVTIAYNLSTRSDVSINIYTPAGVMVKSLMQKDQSPGKHRWEINTNEAGLKPGIYLVQYRAGHISRLARLSIVK